MDIYESGSVVAVEFQFEFNAEIQQSVYRVLDERRVELVGETSISLDGNAVEAQITVPANVNTIDADARRRIFTVELTLTLVGGAIKKLRQSYAIQGDIALRVPTESFQTLPEAMGTALDLGNITGWDAASDAVKTTALIQAHHNIGLLNFDIQQATEFPDFPALEDDNLDVGPFELMTLEEFDALPESFLSALKRAQIVEANDLLGGDKTSKLREQGVLKKTVGESSTTFVATIATRKTVCADAKRMLARYIRSGVKLYRS